MTTKTETCWKKGCEEPATLDYWCEPHFTERRERIRKGMLELRTDMYGTPRRQDAFDQGSIPDPHIIVIRSAPAYDGTGDRDGKKWWWECSCGSKTGSFTRSEGLARGAGSRHRRAAMKAMA